MTSNSGSTPPTDIQSTREILKNLAIVCCKIAGVLIVTFILVYGVIGGFLFLFTPDFTPLDLENGFILDQESQHDRTQMVIKDKKGNIQVEGDIALLDVYDRMIAGTRVVQTDTGKTDKYFICFTGKDCSDGQYDSQNAYYDQLRTINTDGKVGTGTGGTPEYGGVFITFYNWKGIGDPRRRF